MQTVMTEVNTIVIGVAVSMASVILVGGEITKRTSFPRARVMIHQPKASFFRGPTTEHVLESDTMVFLREMITKVYVKRTSKPFWVISADMEKDLFMSATEAQTYGIVDRITAE